MSDARGPGLRRSLLFVPGNRPDRFGKAIASGADIVCIDLEDGVREADKQAARDHALEFLAAERPSCEIAVRVNALQTLAGLRDVLALAESDALPGLIILPKVEAAEEVEWAARLMGGSGRPPGIVSFVETLAGLARLERIAAVPANTMLGLGTADLASDMDVTMQWAPMLLARMQLVQAAKREKLGAIDGAWLQLQDVEGLMDEARRAAALGYTTKVCIHPRQVAYVHAALAPDERCAREARELVAAYEAADSGVIQYNGRMVDLPVVNSARRQLRLWEAAKRG